jgi:hypothetical protein
MAVAEIREVEWNCGVKERCGGMWVLVVRLPTWKLLELWQLMARAVDYVSR